MEVQETRRGRLGSVQDLEAIDGQAYIKTGFKKGTAILPIVGIVGWVGIMAVVGAIVALVAYRV